VTDRQTDAQTRDALQNSTHPLIVTGGM